jgi:hypothetical protein
MCLKETEWQGVDRINLAEDGYKWLVLVNAVMTFGFHKIQGIP